MFVWPHGVLSSEQLEEKNSVNFKKVACKFILHKVFTQIAQFAELMWHAFLAGFFCMMHRVNLTLTKSNKLYPMRHSTVIYEHLGAQ